MSLGSGPTSDHECLGSLCACHLGAHPFESLFPETAGIDFDFDFNWVSPESDDRASVSEEEVDTVICTPPVINLVSFNAFKEDQQKASTPPSREQLGLFSKEERIEMRREKNRLSAKESRERKRAELDWLKQRVNELEAERRELVLENAELKSENIELREALTEYVCERKKPRLI